MDGIYKRIRLRREELGYFILLCYNNHGQKNKSPVYNLEGLYTGYLFA